jgi:hypothetical protein
MHDPMMQPARPGFTPGTLFCPDTRQFAGAVAAAWSNQRYRHILQYLADRGPAPIFEIAAHLGCGDNQISGRFSELECNGVIEKAGIQKIKPSTGCKAECYRICQKESVR